MTGTINRVGRGVGGGEGGGGGGGGGVREDSSPGRIQPKPLLQAKLSTKKHY